MEKLSDTRFEKRLKRVSKMLNSDRFHFSFIGNSVSMYKEVSKIIKIITTKQGISEDREWAEDRIIILDSIVEHLADGIKRRKL
tara:strand:- start:45 stop:296 length:252 start_codon:yes stop_codon:yes gene_type:complete